MVNWQVFILFVGGMGLAMIVAYLLALVGEPQALWFFRDILGVM